MRETMLNNENIACDLARTTGNTIKINPDDAGVIRSHENVTTKGMDFGIDQITLVLLPNEKYFKTKEAWNEKVKEIIDDFMSLSGIGEMWGAIETKSWKLTGRFGYSISEGYPNRDIDFAISHNENYSKNGICVYLGATTMKLLCADYKKHYDEEFNIIAFLKRINSDLYTISASRIDLFADFYNYELSVDELFKGIKSGKYKVKNQNNRCPYRKTEGYENNGKINTFYLGAKGRNSKGYLCVYDRKENENKKRSQLNNNFKMYNDVTRFECRCFHDRAISVLNIFLKADNKEDINSLIAGIISNNYRIIEDGNNSFHEITENLLDVSKEGLNNVFKIKDEKNLSLSNMIQNLIRYTALTKIAYVVMSVYGEACVDEFFECLKKHYKQVVLNHKLQSGIYAKNKSIEKYIRTNALTLEDLPFFKAIGFDESSRRFKDTTEGM